jgi:hypothetical protein
LGAGLLVAMVASVCCAAGARRDSGLGGPGTTGGIQVGDHATATECASESSPQWQAPPGDGRAASRAGGSPARGSSTGSESPAQFPCRPPGAPRTEPARGLGPTEASDSDGTDGPGVTVPLEDGAAASRVWTIGASAAKARQRQGAAHRPVGNPRRLGFKLWQLGGGVTAGVRVRGSGGGPGRPRLSNRGAPASPGPLGRGQGRLFLF